MNKNITAMSASSLPLGEGGGRGPMPAAPSLRGRAGGEAPKHHLFQNDILNVLFCNTEADAASMAQQTLETFEETVMPVPEDMKSRFLAYMLANIETAFEWGWKHANDFAEFKQRGLPPAPPKEG